MHKVVKENILLKIRRCSRIIKTYYGFNLGHELHGNVEYTLLQRDIRPSFLHNKEILCIISYELKNDTGISV